MISEASTILLSIFPAITDTVTTTRLPLESPGFIKMVFTVMVSQDFHIVFVY